MLRNTRRLLGLLLLPTGLLSVSGCAGEIEPRWTQFHADAPSQGGLWVTTKPALGPKWTAAIGEVVYSSPVIGADKVIYVGTLAGDLVAVNTDGTIRWRASFPDSSIFSAPAVGASGFGDIYVISTRKVGDRPASALHAVAPDGTVRWSFDFPRNGYTLASPKEWGFNIFVYVRASSESPVGLNELLVISASGELVARETVHACPVTLTGVSPLDKVFELLACAPACYDPHFRNAQPDPTPAIASYPGLAVQPLVVVADDCGVRAFHWLWGSHRLNLLWHHNTEESQYGSPTVLGFPTGGVVVVPRNSGYSDAQRSALLAYDAASGAKLWERAFEEWVMGMAAAPGTILYVAHATTLHAFAPESGEMYFELSQPSGTNAAPAMSGAYVHLSLFDGTQSVAFDLSSYSVDASARGGFSSPAIANDGTVYVITTDGGLRAYAPR